MNRRTINELKNAIRNPYTWPGGYPVYIVMQDGEMLCHDCARKEYQLILESTRMEDRSGWQCIGAQILWEGEEFCGHCSKKLDSAYGDDE